MNRRMFLKTSSFFLASTLTPLILYANENESDRLDLEYNSLTFFSTGDQIISDKNGVILRLNNGEIIKDLKTINKHTSKLTKEMISRQIKGSETTRIYFNKVTFIRPGSGIKEIAGSEITLLFNNFGVKTESIDSLGESQVFYYGDDGKLIKTKNSNIGTIYRTSDRNTVIIEDLNGIKKETKVYID